MKATVAPSILTLNGGSSSIRFALYEPGKTLTLCLSGKIDRIGLRGTSLTVRGLDGSEKRPSPRRLAAADFRAAGDFLLDWLETQPAFAGCVAVGHRVVHGMAHTGPARVTPRLLMELRRLKPCAPDHLPGEIGLMEQVKARWPELAQVACFDTAFHRTMPRVAKWLAIPRRYAKQGIERYGFHGLSCAYLREELGRIDPVAARGRVLIAHLGNGASLTALRAGRSIDTSMGFTPAAGLVMGTRAGDLDPGLSSFLARTERMTPARFDRMVNHESGLLGIAGTSSDVRDLLARETNDERAAEALALFCYQTKKWIGAFTAALGGVDTLVFAGGIGENAAPIRARICAGLGFLDLKLSPGRNARNAPVISSATSRVVVRVIRTDEERMIAREAGRWLGLGRCA